ncbi:MAG: glycosyltransferase family 4 protein [Patescibacteria group bacterium]|jgi:glycosyltransferase involved in cell wall biosynthesis
MITRKVDRDDGLAGFTYNWIKKLSSKVDELYVMCLEKGNDRDLPDNVHVYSLGKENGKNRFKEFFRFHYLAIKLVPKVDGIFAHQNPEYGILISPWAKIFRKKLIAWYTHKQVSLRLKILNLVSDKMVTASKESFRLVSNKLQVLHHGIDTDVFYFKDRVVKDTLNILNISRISATKRIDKMIDIVAELKKILDKKVVFKIAGVPTLEKDKLFLETLKNKVKEFNLESNVEFLGSVPNHLTPALYQEADLFFNFSQTGSLDKTGLEAMSCGCLVLASNEAFKDILEPINSLFYIASTEQAVENIKKILAIDNNDLRLKLRNYVKENHDLDKLITKIVKLYE